MTTSTSSAVISQTEAELLQREYHFWRYRREMEPSQDFLEIVAWFHNCIALLGFPEMVDFSGIYH